METFTRPVETFRETQMDKSEYIAGVPRPYQF